MIKNKDEISNKSNQATIYTVGHSNVEFETFLGLLNGIEILVDVRSIPFSKHAPQFNIKNIKRQLETKGINYIFMENKYVGNILGGKPNDDECYKNGKIVYEKIMKKEWYKKGISALIKLANNKRTVIMCSEEDPYRCHRHHLISQSLLKEGITVVHIRGDGSKEKVQNWFE